MPKCLLKRVYFHPKYIVIFAKPMQKVLLATVKAEKPNELNRRSSHKFCGKCFLLFFIFFFFLVGSLAVFGSIPFSAFKCSLTSDPRHPDLCHSLPCFPDAFPFNTHSWHSAPRWSPANDPRAWHDCGRRTCTWHHRPPAGAVSAASRSCSGSLSRPSVHTTAAAHCYPHGTSCKDRDRGKEKEEVGEERERFSVEKSMCRSGIINEGAQLSDLLAAGCALTGRTDHTTSATATATATTAEPRNTGW